MMGRDVKRLVESDLLTEAQLQAMSAECLAEIRRLMLEALQVRLRHDLAVRRDGEPVKPRGPWSDRLRQTSGSGGIAGRKRSRGGILEG